MEIELRSYVIRSAAKSGNVKCFKLFLAKAVQMLRLSITRKIWREVKTQAFKHGVISGNYSG